MRGALCLGLLASGLQAGILNYDASVMPASLGITQVIFGDTTMTTSGGVLQMTTYPFEGVWFGGTSGMAPWFLGNYMRVDTQLNAASDDWYIYFGDAHNLALLRLGLNYLTYQDAAGLHTITADLASSFRTIEIWMKNGIVTYAYDHQTIFSGAAVPYGGDPWLIGDPSGTDAGTSGTMFVDQVNIVNGVDFDSSAPAIPPSSPEPSTMLLGGTALGYLVYRRRAAQHRA